MRLSFRLVVAWLVALSFACTDQGTGPATPTDATLALRPSFSSAGATQATRAIHRIRLEARAEGTTDVLLRAVVDVDPSATSWSVPTGASVSASVVSIPGFVQLLAATRTITFSN